MAKVIDLEEVDAAFRKMKSVLGPKADLPGEQGTIVRGLLAVMPAMGRWTATEQNIGTDPEHVLAAMVMITANAVAAELYTLEGSKDDKFQVINDFLLGVASNLGTLIDQKPHIQLSGHEQH